MLSTLSVVDGKSCANDGPSAQCVVADFLSSRPDAASRKAPVQIEPCRRARGAASRNQSINARSRDAATYPYPPATRSVSTASAKSAMAKLGTKQNPSEVLTGSVVTAAIERRYTLSLAREFAMANA